MVKSFKLRQVSTWDDSNETLYLLSIVGTTKLFYKKKDIPMYKRDPIVIRLFHYRMIKYEIIFKEQYRMKIHLKSIFIR